MIIVDIIVVGVLALGAYAIYKNRATIEADLKVKFAAKLETIVAQVKVDAQKLEATAKAEVTKAVDFVVAEIKAKL